MLSTAEAARSDGPSGEDTVERFYNSDVLNTAPHYWLKLLALII